MQSPSTSNATVHTSEPANAIAFTMSAEDAVAALGSDVEKGLSNQLLASADCGYATAGEIRATEAANATNAG